MAKIMAAKAKENQWRRKAAKGEKRGISVTA
jgi:hypothetical protein